MSSEPMSSGAAVAQTVGDTSGTLDGASVTWFTAVCSGLAPLKETAAKIGTAGAGGTDAEKLQAVAPVLAEVGKLYSTTATAASALPPPGFPGGADYATKSIAAFQELSTLFQTGSTSAAGGDNNAVATLQSDASKGPAALAMSTLSMTTATKTAIIAKIPSCTDIIT